MRKKSTLVTAEIFILELLDLFIGEMNQRILRAKDPDLAHRHLRKGQHAAFVSALGNKVSQLYDLTCLIQILRNEGKLSVSPELREGFLRVTRSSPRYIRENESSFILKWVEITQRIDAFFGFET